MACQHVLSIKVVKFIFSILTVVITKGSFLQTEQLFYLNLIPFLEPRITSNTSFSVNLTTPVKASVMNTNFLTLTLLNKQSIISKILTVGRTVRPKSIKRVNLPHEKKIVELSNARKRMADIRMQATPEKKFADLSNLRERMANYCAGMSPLKAKTYKLIDNERKISIKKKLTFGGSLHRIQAFKSQILKGSYYICVVCNRTLYKTSVHLFLESKYEASDVVFYSRVKSFDSLEYICRTCHSKLLKNKIPAQAVCNDLRIFNLPERFSDIRKLEKIIISKRILFKKVTIMSKGQAPKMKGAICNVPINAADICNVLPRGMDNNGVVRVALKKKMCFK